MGVGLEVIDCGRTGGFVHAPIETTEGDGGEGEGMGKEVEEGGELREDESFFIASRGDGVENFDTFVNFSGGGPGTAAEGIGSFGGGGRKGDGIGVDFAVEAHVVIFTVFLTSRFGDFSIALAPGGENLEVHDGLFTTYSRAAGRTVHNSIFRFLNAAILSVFQRLIFTELDQTIGAKRVATGEEDIGFISFLWFEADGAFLLAAEDVGFDNTLNGLVFKLSHEVVDERWDDDIPIFILLNSNFLVSNIGGRQIMMASNLSQTQKKH